MKKNIFYISVMSCAFCIMASVSYSATLEESLVAYCVPRDGNSCDPKTEKATYTNDGCSCYIGREYNTEKRQCVECLLKDGGYNGYYKSKVGVDDCSQVVCSGGTYLEVVDVCQMGSYKDLLQDPDSGLSQKIE